MLHTTSQGHMPSGSGEEDLLKGFDYLCAWRSSWSCDQNILYTFWLTIDWFTKSDSLLPLAKACLLFKTGAEE